MMTASLYSFYIPKPKMHYIISFVSINAFLQFIFFNVPLSDNHTAVSCGRAKIPISKTLECWNHFSTPPNKQQNLVTINLIYLTFYKGKERERERKKGRGRPPPHKQTNKEGQIKKKTIFKITFQESLFTSILHTKISHFSFHWKTNVLNYYRNTAGIFLIPFIQKIWPEISCTWGSWCSPAAHINTPSKLRLYNNYAFLRISLIYLVHSM